MGRNGLHVFDSIHVKLSAESRCSTESRFNTESRFSTESLAFLQNHARILTESSSQNPSDSCQNPSDSCRITFFGRNTESHDSCRITKKEGSRIMSQRPNLRPRLAVFLTYLRAESIFFHDSKSKSNFNLSSLISHNFGGIFCC